MDSFVSFAELFYQHALASPDSPALWVSDHLYSYGEVAAMAKHVACQLQAQQVHRVGIVARRTLAAYVGILAAHWVGATFIPLNPTDSPSRLKKMLASAQIDILISDPPTAKSFADFPPQKPQKEALAYLMYTAGSTGEPKGVPISFNNLQYFFNGIAKRFQLDKSARVAQQSSLYFDDCILEMGLAWMNGATLYVVPEQQLADPGNFLKKQAITFCVCTPSLVKILTANVLPDLKYCVFTGEALTLQQIALWKIAAPNCSIENFYGSTEITVNCLGQSFDAAIHCPDDKIPIGKPFPEIFAGIIDTQNRFLTVGEKGELVISGEQIAQGYWQDLELTQQKFLVLTHPVYGAMIWYLTGDYCYFDAANIYHYCGRMHNQNVLEDSVC